MSFTSDYQQIDIEVCDEQGNERYNDNKLNWRIHTFLNSTSQP
ncbi:hypothetical protein [Shewanella surugensis]|nr:hypothetical protein [Shewanella surugensis]